MAKGGQYLFWHVALRASHVLGESCVSAYAGVVLSSGVRGSPATERPPVDPVCGPAMLLARQVEVQIYPLV